MSRDIYFNQLDTRWKNHIFSSVGNLSQNIGNSGCGPTSIAMLISSLKNNINVFPHEIGDELVANGFRTASDGTSWGAFPYIAEKYGLEYFETTDINEVVNVLNRGGMVIASCGSGVFSTGGHIIVLNSMRDTETITVYDPSLYQNKYNQYGRADKVWLEGHCVNISIENLEAYGNVLRYFCYINNEVVEETQVQEYQHTREQDIKDLKVSLCAGFPDCDLDMESSEFDEATRQAVERHTLEEGDNAPFVNWFKDMLKSYAYDIKDSENYFDSDTADIVEEFQEGNGLPVDRKISLDDVECLLDY